MPIENVHFSELEYSRRIALVRAAMAQREIDILFITNPSNQFWLTGYDGWSFYTHQGVILPMEGAPYWWGRFMDANGARRTVWMEEENILHYNDAMVQSDIMHPMEDLASHLRIMGYGKARIGVEMETYFYTAKAHAVLYEGLPEATLLDASVLVNWQRLIKSDEELRFMRRAARISELVIERAMELAEPGLRKHDLVGELYRTAVQGEEDSWGDYPAIVPMLPSGPDASAPHLTWNGEALKAGEATFVEQSGCYRRYHAPLCRTVFLGKPPQHMIDASEALTEGLNAGIEVARAGNRACDIARALNVELAKVGIERPNRAGYAVGCSYPPDWGEHTVSIRDTDETILEPGMTFHFMPGLWMDHWGMETTETIVITEDGPAMPLCNVERKLFIKD
ncbi:MULTISPECIES: M24 family metallopeptidase [unclassified Thioclava]|uniref:M24 family metallopeptidase n=1 Tax=unclassified Thioclava TaxID=2621713 RepID=UPI00099712DD|nr:MULTISPECIES: M24 family metallopeptidase [unclassified Thioclava]OOY16606.1 ectoine hydrolase DoeA [Thioclava sp. DLFJ4-1]OOY19803.1 ectoine hydrolase DoeA [Thioclava sp. DLFJ5-1]OOY31471.1 ectoine hydrolase DoeA [Thioclava sp. F36-6]